MPQDANKISNRDFFKELLGFDPGKEEDGGEQVIAKAIKELQEKRIADAVEKLKGIIMKVGELCRKRDHAALAFRMEDAKFEKELGNLRKQIIKFQNGNVVEDESEASGEGGENNGGGKGQ